MGIFHYKIALLPREYFGQPLPTALSETDIERGEETTSGWWASYPPSAKLLGDLRALLPIEDRSWGGDIEQYISTGDWSSDVRIWKDGGRVWGLTFRFSAVVNGWPLMQRFLSIAREECLLLEVESHAIFEPDEDAVKERFMASRAAQFLRDPAGSVVQAARELKD